MTIAYRNQTKPSGGRKTDAVLCTLALMLWGIMLPAQAAFQSGNPLDNVLIGRDNDNVAHPEIQPSPPPRDQSLNNDDILEGRGGDDILIGLLGDDVLRGGRGDDILIGDCGDTSQLPPDESGNPVVFDGEDIIYGNAGNDVSLWAPGDGRDVFIGGAGDRDAQVFGVIDLDEHFVPILTPVEGQHQLTGLPTANVTGSPGFCTLDRVTDPELGFEFLVRFFHRGQANEPDELRVTLRLIGVEQVFCTSQAGGAITFADLTQAEPEFVEITLDQVEAVNSTVARIIR